MLDAFADRLQAELKKPQISMERYLRRFVDPTKVHEARADVEHFLTDFPENINLLSEFLSAPDTPLVVRLFYASVLAYLINPKDFLPEQNYGLYGFLDDAYLVTCALTRTMAHVPRNMRERRAETIARVRDGQDLCKKVAGYLPPDVLEKLVSALDSFETAAFLVCEKNSVGELQALLGSRFAKLLPAED